MQISLPISQDISYLAVTLKGNLRKYYIKVISTISQDDFNLIWTVFSPHLP